MNLQVLTPHANLFFIGLMGTGKTTVGRAIARRLGLEFCDSDHEIERRAGVPIAMIFEHEGEAGFRQREIQVIDDLSQRSGIVLATGGGAVLSEQNRVRLHQRGIVIYLFANPHDLWRRTQFDKDRPLLQTGDRRAQFEAMFTIRDPLYRECAHFIIHNTGHPSINVSVSMVFMQLELAGANLSRKS